MKTLEKAQDKIQKICTAIREETLAPAQKEAQQIIEKAQREAEEILRSAEKAAHALHEEARTSVEKERKVFEATLKQASEQCVLGLRQSIEGHFFDGTLVAQLEKSAASPEVIADLLNAIVHAIQKEGLDTNLSALVPHHLSPRQLNEMLMKEVLKTLKEKSVVLADFKAGVQVKLNNKRLTIDISEAALKELLGSYIARKDFRKLVFGSA